MATKKSTKSENTALQQLKSALKTGELAQLYFFFGEEVYLRDNYLTRLKAVLLPDGLEDFNLHLLQGKECTPLTLSDAIDNLPMMSERSLVLVQDLDIFKANQEDQQAYADLLSDLPEYVCLVFVYDTISLDRRTIKGPFARLLKNSPALVQFTQQENTDLIPWITARFKQLDKTIDRSQAEYLIFVTGGSMSNLIAEIEKVGAYAKARSITRSDIDAVCDPVLDAVTFQMTDLIGQGQFDKALAVLSDLYAMQQPPQMIMGALSRQIRQMYTARIAYEGGKSADWLAEIWSMKQSWQADRLLRNCRRFSARWYRTAVKLTAEADRRSKLTATEANAILIELLLRMAEAAQA